MGVLMGGRLDNAVNPGTIGIGETVEICTRMGNPVAMGEVSASTPFGLSLKAGGFYKNDLHLFIPVVEKEHEVEAVNAILSSPDERVLAKMRTSGQSVPMFEMDKISDTDGRDDTVDHRGLSNSDEKERDDDKDSDKDDDKKSSDQKKNKPVADKNSSIDVDELPDDIKKAVIPSEHMDDEQLNDVLGGVGDAVIKAFKRANVDEMEIYDLTGKIQKAVRRILTTSSSEKDKKE